MPRVFRGCADGSRYVPVADNSNSTRTTYFTASNATDRSSHGPIAYLTGTLMTDLRGASLAEYPASRLDDIGAGRLPNTV